MSLRCLFKRGAKLPKLIAGDSRNHPVYFGVLIGVCLLAVCEVYLLFGVLFGDSRCLDTAKGVWGVLKSLVGSVYGFVK